MGMWAVIEDGVYQAIGQTQETLTAGMYSFAFDGRIKVVRAVPATDRMLELPDEISEGLLRGMAKFWLSEARYRKHGVLYKRGVLLYGDPGAGKTALLTLMSRQLVDQGGFVVHWSGGWLTGEGLRLLRKTHPKNPIICIIEDIDEVIDREGYRPVLALLDGESQVDGVIWLATTNYLDQLPATLVNRPSRFDEVIEIGMPSAAARKVYLQHMAPEVIADLDKWVTDTEGFSIAHLKELAAAVLCLDHPYEKTLGRIRKMTSINPPVDVKAVSVDAALPENFGDIVLTAPAPEVTVGV